MNVQHGGGITPFYTTIINTTIPICSFFNGTDNNLVAKWMLDSIKDTLPEGFIHPCPYFGTFKALNVSLASNTFMSQFLKGRYKSSLRLFDDKDENIVTYFFGFEL